MDGQQETTEGCTDRQIPYLVIRQRESNQDVALSLICPVSVLSVFVAPSADGFEFQATTFN